MTSTSRKVRIGLAAGALIVLPVLLGAASCDADKALEPFQDAPIASKDKTPAVIVEMPDGFSNLATKCVDGVRYVAAYKADLNRASVTAFVDPKCPR